MQVWTAAVAVDRQDTRYTWHQNLSQLLAKGKISSHQLVGPAIATIQAILDIGWKPVRPDFWIVDDATSVKVNQEPFTKLQVIARASKDLQKKLWQRAAKHEHGGGLEKGIPFFKAARRALKFFRKRGMFAQAKALEFAVVGFFRDPTPEDISTKAFCHRCGKRARNTRLHQIYFGQDNETITDETFVNRFSR